MFSFLKNHPFAVEARFDFSLVLSFAVPKNEIRHLLPDPLEPDCFNDEWAFLAVAMVQTRGLRPKGFPGFSGRDFFLIGYRIFVRYTNSAGKCLRGLYILKSETDKKSMQLLGNLFTNYRYEKTDIGFSIDQNKIKIYSAQNGFSVIANQSTPEIALPETTPFTSWQEARRFAGPLPFTFSYNSELNEMVIVKGMRENWTPVPVAVDEYKIPFLNSLNLNNIRLANAFMVKNIPYAWEKGRKETCTL